MMNECENKNKGSFNAVNLYLPSTFFITGLQIRRHYISTCEFDKSK